MVDPFLALQISHPSLGEFPETPPLGGGKVWEFGEHLAYLNY